MADREECTRCGVVGPVDVACVGCARAPGREAMAALFDRAMALGAARLHRDDEIRAEGRFPAPPARDVRGLGEFAVSRADFYRRVSFDYDRHYLPRRGGLSRCRRLAPVLAARLVLA